MILSEKLRARHDEVGIGWNRWEERCGAPKNSFIRASQGITAFPHPDLVRALAVALGTTPAKVVLAAAEEVGLYDPAEDGYLSRTMIPEDLARAARELADVAARYQEAYPIRANG